MLLTKQELEVFAHIGKSAPVKWMASYQGIRVIGGSRYEALNKLHHAYIKREQEKTKTLVPQENRK